MSDSLFSEMFDTMLADVPQASWHESVRHDLGIPEECAGEALISIVISRHGGSSVRPIAFVIEPHQTRNTVLALAEFLREAFHPVTGRKDVVAVVDFLPPLDDFGTANGICRRWLVDASNYQVLMADIGVYVNVRAEVRSK